MDKNREKAERRAQKKLERQSRPSMESEEEDPDIAGIVPGPQPLPPEFGDYQSGE